jgi:hypothetical protein
LTVINILLTLGFDIVKGSQAVTSV